MAGIQNSWISATVLDQPSPCAETSQQTGTISDCVLWLIVGLLIGSLTFEKKGTQQ